jgi:hypothetical protein
MFIYFNPLGNDPGSIAEALDAITADICQQRADTVITHTVLIAKSESLREFPYVVSHNNIIPLHPNPLTGENARALLALIYWAQAQGYWPLTSIAAEYHRSYHKRLQDIRSYLYQLSAADPEPAAE